MNCCNFKLTIMKNIISDYWYITRIQGAGEGWTRNPVFASCVFPALFAGSICPDPN